jgi:iron complex outermembrane receptor protein
MKKSLLASAIALALHATGSWAQTPPVEEKKPDDRKDVVKGGQITVTAVPLARAANELAQPATVLDQEDLRRKRAASIGDTLSQEVGVTSSAFGPGAGRPVIRGLDGPRVRVLENGIGTLDVSTVSPDHMVTTESLHADQIEILRGPASLLYGSGAIGGVVNIVSNLIPRKPASGLSGDVETRFSSGNNERTGAFNLNGGGGEWAWHIDAFKRKQDDYKIPSKARDIVNEHRDVPIEGDKLPDTFVDAKGGGIGGSYVTPRGYAGLGAETVENTYGVPTGENSHIHLKQKRYEASGETADPVTGFSKLRFRIAHTDYQHEEIESTGAVATTFKNKATEGRLELTHGPWGGGITGTIGVQGQDDTLSALGEEALIPKTHNKAAALFAVEQKDFGAWVFDAGLRIERVTRRPSVDEENADKFADAIDRNFTLTTPAIGVVWKFMPGYNLGLAATQAQRAPATEELYSKGAHGATATFDIGTATLNKEVSRNIDLTLRKTTGEHRWKVNVFANRIKDYVFGAFQDVNGDGIPDRVDDTGALDPEGEFLVQHFSQADARFHGVEAEWRWRPERGWGGVRLFGDMVRGKLANGGNLPRIAPARLGVELDGTRGPWNGHLTTIYAFKQDKTAELETPTPGYTRVDAELAYRLSDEKDRTLTVFLQGTNLLDRSIQLHTSYLKDIAPLMGRSFTIGLRGEF